MLLVGLLPLVVGIYYVYHSTTKTLKESIGRNFQILARETADKINIILNREITNTRSLSLLPVITDATSDHLSSLQKEDLLRFIKDYKNHRKGEILDIFILDKAGRVIVTTDSVNYGVIEEEIKKWNILLKKNKRDFLISNIRSNDLLNLSYILITVPLRNLSHTTFFGSIHILYNAKEIYTVINSIKVGKTGHANLVASDGTLLICPLFPPQSHTIRSDLLRQISVITPGWGIAADDAHGGKDSIIGFSPVRITLKSGINFDEKNGMYL